VEALTRPSLNGCVKSIFFNVEGHSWVFSLLWHRSLMWIFGRTSN
jgi:hypothetical protein